MFALPLDLGQFAEPNNLNNTERSFRSKSGLIPIFIGTSPKKQVNRRRLRLPAAQNLSYRGSETPHQIHWVFLYLPHVFIQRTTTIFTEHGIVVVTFLHTMRTNLC